MAKLLSITLALIGCSLAEPPVGYNYQSSPASQWHGYNAFGGGGSYTPVPVGPQTSEGYHVDPHLLENIKHILLKDEIHNGPQEYSEEEGRIVGIELIDIQQSVELAQYHQSEGDTDQHNYASHDNHEDSSNSHSHYYSGPQKSYQPPSKTFGPPGWRKGSSAADEGENQSSSYDVPIESAYEPGPSSYEDHHSLNVRNVRKTPPFHNTPHRPIFYKFHY